MRARWAVWGAASLLAASLPVAALLHTADAATTPVPCLSTPAQSGQALTVAFAQADAAPGDDTLTLGGCQYDVSGVLAATAADQLTVAGVAGSIVSGGGATQVFRVAAGAHLVLSRLAVTGGEAGSGPGGAADNAGTLEVVDSTLSGNTGFDGGAIWSSGTLRVTRSLLRDNTATGELGDSGRGRDIALSTGQAVVLNSTFVGGRGVGALYVLSGTASVAGATIAGFTNYALYNSDGLLGIAGSAISAGDVSNCFGPINDEGGNISSDASCVTSAQSLGRTDPVLLPLADYGGATLTMAPGPGSPAIGFIAAAPCDAAGFEDARQRARPQGDRCDAGAVESASVMERATAGPSFGATPVGTARYQTLTFTSRGADPLRIGYVRFQRDASYEIVAQNCAQTVLPDGASCTIKVGFSPSDTATHTAELQVASTDRSEPLARIPFTGSGSAAPPPPPPTSPPPTSPPPTSPPPTSPPPPTSLPTPPPPTTSPTTSPTPSLAPAPTASPTATASPAPVVPPSPSGAAPADGPRPRADAGASEPDLFFASYVPPPSEVPTTLTTVIGSSLLALLLLALLSLPVTVVNDTLSAHREDIAAQLAGIRARLAFLPRLRHESMHPAVVLTIAAAGAAVINSFLDPGFGWNRGSAVDFVGLLGSLLVVSAAARLAADQWCERRLRADTVMRLIPGFWLLAVTCVALSRTTGFRPGLLLGTLATVQVTRALNAQEEGQKTAFAYVVTAVVSLLAWLAYEPVSRYVAHTEAAGQHAGFGMLVLQTVLATVFLGGIGGSLFGLVPLDFLDGGAVRAWSFRVWFVLFFAALLGFVHVLLRSGPGDDPLLNHLRYLEVLLGIYLLCAAAFWGYWKRREARARRTA